MLDEGTRGVGEEEVRVEEGGWDVIVGKLVLNVVCGELEMCKEREESVESH